MASLHTLPLTDRELLSFEGEDARAFLHGQLTCDVAGLAADASTYGAYCTPKGRALATFLLWGSGTQFTLQLPASLRASVQKRLSMYILRSRVRADDATPRLRQYGLVGAGASDVVAQWLGSAPHRDHAVVTGARGTALRLPGDRHLLIAPADAAAALETALAAHPALPADAWNARDIAAGVATVLPATQEQFVPQMLNLDALGGVSFNKGCYPGQEIVARMHYLGKLKERLIRARVSAGTPVAPGDRIYGADLGTQAAGMVTNAAAGDDGSVALLAVVQTSSVAAGPLHLHAADGPALVIEPLPYALPSR